MAYISEEEINSIRDKANIVDIIADYMPLNKAGNDYVGVCPFHDDHSPSMHVSPKLNIFKCFVCNTGGNVFTFVQKHENVSFMEAVKIVASKSGIAFNHEINNQSTSKYKKEFDIMDLSLKFFQNNLASSDGIDAKKYLISRGIDDAIIKDFKIGLSLSNNKLKEFFDNKKISLETAFDIGLLNKSGIDYFDVFQNRIMIPIYDMQGNLAGYTARAYLKDEKSKYINSKETIIYKKSNILFNYYNAKDIARLEKQIVVVEGNMDAITMCVYGIKNVIALMGVVISKNQIDALKKLNSKIILMLDNDNAGKSATLSVGKDLYDAGLDVNVVRLTGAKDPDEYIRKFGVDALKENINHPKKYLDFKFETLKENKNLDNIEELTSYIKDVIASLQNASELEREIAISKICKDYNIDPNLIKKNLVPITKKEIKKDIKPKKKQSKYEKCVSNLIYAMLLNKDYYEIYNDKLGYLLNKIERDVVSLIGSYISKYNKIDISGFIDYIITYDDISDYVNEIITNNDYEISTKEEFCDILSAVIKSIDEEEIKDLKEKIKNETDESKKIILMNKLTELKKGSGNNERN